MQTSSGPRMERLGGVLMLAAVAAALLAANGPLAPLYQAVHHAPVHVRIGPLVTEGPLIEWINRGLMTAFWVLLLIVPIFAFLNAGVRIDGAAVANLTVPVSVAVLLGLVIGKPLGISVGILIAVRTRISRLTPDVSPRLAVGIAQLGGIGFTMSFFLVTLAFGGAPLATPARLAVLLGSALSSVIGLAILKGASAPAASRPLH